MKLRGQAASPGIASGLVFLFQSPAHRPASNVSPSYPASELTRFRQAMEAVNKELQVAIDLGDADAAAIFQAHLLMLADSELLERVEAGLQEGKRAEDATGFAIATLADSLRVLDDEYLRGRAADIEDLGRRLMNRLAGATQQSFPAGAIVVAHELAPSDMMRCAQSGVAGMATEGGSTSSHAAILARAFHLPAVMGVAGLIQAATAGVAVTVDGDEGTVIISPTGETQHRITQSKVVPVARPAVFPPASTKDGHRVALFANLGRPEELEFALAAGAEGVGLLRTEFLFMEEPPSEETQYRIYRSLARELAGRLLTIRTLDAGGDKPVPWLPVPHEANPFLGQRGIRLSLAHPSVFRTQLRAILRAAAHGHIRMMFPMVTSQEEVTLARNMLATVRQELATEGTPAGEVEVGAMVEVPAAAICASALGELVDFFSIGTNDLAQYVLAADRNNPAVADIYNQAHPAVLHLIKMTVEGAHRWERPVAICGELATDPQMLPLLVGMGVDELSVSPEAMARVRTALSSIKCGDAARQATII